MLIYLLEVSACWLGFYGLYYGWLSRETFFHLNRYYLTGTLAAGLLIPLLSFPFSIDWFQLAAPDAIPAISVEFPETNQTMTILPDPAPSALINWSAWITGLYCLGAGVVFIRFAAGMAQLYRLYRDGIKERRDGYQVVLTPTEHLPFSFGNLIFKPQANHFSEAEEEKILLHELAHVRGRHSIDVLLVEILGIFFWFNPLIYLYRQSLKVIHEYIADAAVVSLGQKKQYGHLLLRQSLSGPSVALANHFFHSQLKKRINMMMQLPSPAKARLKYLLAAPILLAALGLFGQTQEKTAAPPVQIKEVAVAAATPENPLYILDGQLTTHEEFNKIDPNSIESIEVLKGEKATSEFGDSGKNGVIIVVTKTNAGYQAPRFPGCEDLKQHPAAKNICAQQQLFEFIISEMNYPEAAKKAGTEGTAVAAFSISETGKVQDLKIVKSVSPEIDAEVLRLIGEMPDWIPAQKGGKAVASEFKLPLKFKLSDAAPAPNNAEEIFKVVEEMPLFPADCADQETDKKKCSDIALMNFIFRNIRYPQLARDHGIMGTVVIGFVIEKDGSMSDFKILKGIGGGCEEEALRVVKLIHEKEMFWTPGKQRGQAVRVQFNLPVRFHMELESQPRPIAAPKLEIAKEAPRLELMDFSASPNPTSGQLELRFKGAATATVLLVYDASGKVVFQSDLPGFDGHFNQRIDLSGAPAGILTLAVFQQDKVYTHPFVKQ